MKEIKTDRYGELVHFLSFPAVISHDLVLPEISTLGLRNIYSSFSCVVKPLGLSNYSRSSSLTQMVCFRL